MTAFSIDMSGPFPAGSFTGGLGGPNQGGHQAPNWYIQYGMDLGAAEGTGIYATFDAYITRFKPHDPATDSGKVYGADADTAMSITFMQDGSPPVLEL